jgi:alpha-L-arabinofuranosidase
MKLALQSCSLLLLSAVAAGAQPASGRPVLASIDAAQPAGRAISPYLYGQFIEHAGNLMYSALWSELLDDRKFYYAVMPKPAEEPVASPREPGQGPNRRRGVGPGRWNPIGPVESVVMDSSKPFAGDHAPLIKLAGAEPRGIRQTGVNLVQGVTYHGRIQLAGDPGANVSINLVWVTNSGAARQAVPLGELSAAYQKQTFSFKAENSGAAQFEIVGTGTGTFHVGAVSLMPAEHRAGWRPDAIAALKSLRSGVYRFPGGNFVSAHEWRDAIGDPDQRPPTYDPVWRALQPNDIGTDEFLTLCQLLEVEPYITVNAGTGDAQSAAQYVEYANGAVTTPMGQLRAAHGHPEPYGVKFWGIGNEMWGHTYQYGAMLPNQYVFKHNQFAKAMRKVDASITLLASGAMPDTMIGAKESLSFGTNLVPAYFSAADWTGNLLSNCFSNFELLSEHYYNFGNTHFSLAEGKQVPNDPNEPVTDWMRRAANHVQIKAEHYRDYEKLLPQLAQQPKPLAISEWAYTGGKYPAYPALGWVFHEMFRHSDLIQMANYTFATSLLTGHRTNTTLNANGLLFQIYARHFGRHPVRVTGNSPQPPPTAPFGGEQPAVNAGSATFPLDVVAAWTADRRTLTVAVLNPTEVEQSLQLKIAGAKLTGTGTLWRLASGEPDGQNPVLSNLPVEVVPAALTLPRFSVNIYEFSASE